MKKLVSFLLVFVLAFSLSISAFATNYNGVELPDVYSVWTNTTDNPYALIMGGSDWQFSSKYDYALYIARSPIYVQTSTNKVKCSVKVMYYGAKGNSWEFVEWVTLDTSLDIYPIVWSSHDLIDTNGDIYFPASVECDGTSCPANDINHDNICDDCGNVLTMSLRSTLLDYAKTHAETNGNFASTHKYYAVVEHPTDSDKYVVYVSEILMGSTDQQTVTGGNMKMSVVVTMESGSFGNQGWIDVDSWSGNVVYANHTIPFFFRVPLMVTVQGPTGEQMEMGTLNLTEVFSILVRCGIGLMALLMALVLLSKKLRRFMA